MHEHIDATQIQLDERGRISLPAKLRNELGWSHGEKLIVAKGDDGSLHIVSLAKQIANMRGVFSGSGKKTSRSLATELIKERRQEVSKEASKAASKA